MTTIGGQLAAYLRSIRAFGFPRLAVAATLVMLGTIVEGFGIVLLVPLVGIVFGGPMPATAARLFAALSIADRGAQLTALLSTFALLATLRGVVLWQRELRLMDLSLALVDAWRRRLVEALSRASWPTLLAMRRSNVEFAITTEVGRLGTGSDRLLRGASSLLQLLLQAALALYMAPLLTPVALVLLSLALPLLVPMLRAAHRYGTDMTQAGGTRHAALSDFVAGMKLAKAYDSEERYTRDFVARSNALRARALAYLDAQQRAGNAFQIVAVFAAIALLLVGLYLTHTPPALLSAMLVLLSRLTAPVLALAQGAQALLTMLPAVGSLCEIERTLLAGSVSPSAPASITVTAPGPAAITLAGVGYRHDPHGPAVLDNAQATIGAGEFVALIGPSGAGKTTLADIVTGLLTPATGALLIDGVRIADDAARTAWRRQTGYVPQDPFLFDDSLIANLRWAAPEASEAEIWHALEAAEAAPFVRTLPDGLETRMAIVARGYRVASVSAFVSPVR
jgi:ATP-binding cassette subfamily C protein